MLGAKYTIKSGDSLWSIAGQFLDDSPKWPLIYEYNNQPQVTMATRTRINDPDLIFVGQVIYIPSNGYNRSSSKPKQPNLPSAKPLPVNPNRGKTIAKSKLYSIPFKFDFGIMPSLTVASPTYIATIRLLGSVTIQSEKMIDFITIAQQHYEFSSKREADLVFGKLVSETKVGYNPATKQITFECGITTQARFTHSPEVGTAVAVSSTTGLPVIKASVKYPPLKGQVSNHFFASNDFSVEIEVTPHSPSTRPLPIPSAKPVPLPSASRKPALPTGPSVWDYLVGGALIATATILVVGTVAEDALTLGAGIADDAPCFATAAGMFVLGVNRYKSVPGVVPVTVPSSKL